MTTQNSAGTGSGDPAIKPIDIVLGDELRATDDDDTFLDWTDEDDEEWGSYDEEDDDE